MKNWPREITLTPLEAQMHGAPTFGNPVDLGDGHVAVAPEMPTRRSVSIEEFEADMALVRGG